MGVSDKLDKYMHFLNFTRKTVGNEKLNKQIIFSYFLNEN